MDHIKSILNKRNIPFSRLEALSPNRATLRSTCTSGMSYFALNTIVLQLSDTIVDTSLPERPAIFQILLTSVHFVADNASHELASTATVRSTFNDEEEDAVIRNGWTPEEKEVITSIPKMKIHDPYTFGQILLMWSFYL